MSDETFAGLVEEYGHLNYCDKSTGSGPCNCWVAYVEKLQKRVEELRDSMKEDCEDPYLLGRATIKHYRNTLTAILGPVKGSK